MGPMYSVTVRDRFMIAHSFQGEIFGPARALHGATYIVDVRFERERLDEDQLVVDIGRASEVLAEVVGEFAFKNLDDLEEFRGKNTTTEFMARVVFDRMIARMHAGALGRAADRVSALRVTLHESDVASASFEGAMPVRRP